MKKNNKQIAEEAIALLKIIHLDATMALNGDWNKCDEGFDAQQNLIEKLFKKHGIEFDC